MAAGDLWVSINLDLAELVKPWPRPVGDSPEKSKASSGQPSRAKPGKPSGGRSS